MRQAARQPSRSPQQPAREPAYLEGAPMLLVMGAVTTASLLALLDSAIVATAIPKITSDFHSLPDISWYGAAFQLASAATQPLVGRVYSLFRLKSVYLAFFLVFELGSLLCGAAASSAMLVVGRAVAGIGVAGVFAGALTIIGTAVRPQQRALLMGICIGCAQMGVVAGPLLGGALTEKVSWRWCFYINLPLGAIVLAGTLFVDMADGAARLPALKVLPTLHRRLDLVGFCLLSPAAVMLLLALQWGGNAYDWGSATVVGLLCGAAATLACFVAWNRHKGDEGLVPTSLLRNGIVVASCGVSMAAMGSTLLTSYWMPVYFQTVRGDTPLGSGVYMLPNIVPSLLLGVVTGFLIGKVGYYLPFAVAGGALSAVACGLLSTLGPDAPAARWVGYQLLLGAGRGLVQQTSFIAIPHATTPELVPVAMSMSIFSQYMGGAVFVSLSNVVFGASLRGELRRQAPGVDAELVVRAGAYAVRDAGIAPELLPGVLGAYCTSVNRVFYLAAGAAGALFAACCLSGCVDTRAKGAGKGPDEERAETERATDKSAGESG